MKIEKTLHQWHIIHNKGNGACVHSHLMKINEWKMKRQNQRNARKWTNMSTQVDTKWQFTKSYSFCFSSLTPLSVSNYFWMCDICGPFMFHPQFISYMMNSTPRAMISSSSFDVFRVLSIWWHFCSRTCIFHPWLEWVYSSLCKLMNDSIQTMTMKLIKIDSQRILKSSSEWFLRYIFVLCYCRWLLRGSFSPQHDETIYVIIVIGVINHHEINLIQTRRTRKKCSVWFHYHLLQFYDPLLQQKYYWSDKWWMVGCTVWPAPHRATL